MTGSILLTGAAGRVGGLLRPLLLERYGRVVLSDIVEPTDLMPGEEYRKANLADFDQVDAACDGVDAVVHLGGQSVEADWATVSRANIEGTYTVFEAARRRGISRVVFASSHHVDGMYERQRRIGPDHRPRPDTRYGVSKVLGEALGSLYADKYGLRVLSIRIGNVDTVPRDLRRLSVFVHPEDLMQLIVIGIESDAVHNQVVFGISDNARAFWDNSEAYRLGYSPKHRADDHIDIAMAGEAEQDPSDPIAQRLQGASFAALEFNGDIDRLTKS